MKAARDGDVIVVEDGFYFEKNIIVDKKLLVKARHPFGAVIYGSNDPHECIFIIRAQAEIQGFLLKNSGKGIMQRDSPDVLWRGRDLAIFDMDQSAIEVNDVQANVGSALLENVIIYNCRSAIATNDAGEISIRDSLICNCRNAFNGSNHLLFNVEKTVLWNCQRIISEDNLSPRPPGTNKIQLSGDVLNLDDHISQTKIIDIQGLLNHFFNQVSGDNISIAEAYEFRTGLIENIIGEFYFREKNFILSKKCFSLALESAAKTKSAEIAIKALFSLGAISEKQQDFPGAIDNYKRAIHEIDIAIGSLPLKFYQAGFFEDKIEIYESLLNRLYDFYTKESRGNYATEAFYFAEKSKAVGAIAALSESHLEGQAGVDEETENKARKILEKISRLRRLIDLSRESDQDLRIRFEKLEDAEDEFKSFLIRLKPKGLSIPPSQYYEPFRAERIQRELLRPDEALVEYFLGSSFGYAFALRKDSIDMVSLPSPAYISSAVSNYMNFLTLEKPKDFLGSSGGRILYDALVSPLINKFPSRIKKIIIIPDGILYYIPFETLIRPGPAGAIKRSGIREQNGRYFVEDYEIGYAPSAACLMVLHERKRIKEGSRKLLGIAYAGPGPEKNRSRLYPDLPKITQVEKEICSIAGLFPKERRKLLLGSEAKEDILKKSNLTDFQIIHLSVHGIFDDRHWWRSGLILNCDRNGPEDGILGPLDLLDLRMGPDLVVLSACQSGSGYFEKGEGSLGLSLSFLLSGANSVVSSLWAINDESTIVFMKDFYRNLVLGESTSKALRQAKLDMMNSKYRHPVYWAAFVLIGESTSPFATKK
jgi:CHAT domain-containing protein